MSTSHRLTEPARQSFFLFGMRGVGKSTWARATFPDAAYVDLLDERLYQDLLADPSLFAQSVGHLPPDAWVVVDEVQRLPALLNEVHRLIETRRLRFALVGSSARKLKAAGTNLLAGRALKRTMFPLTAAELGAEFDLERVLRHGSVPLVWTSDAPRAVLETYAQLYLREEIRAEALVRNLPGFVRFLPVAALFNGQVVNVAGIARDAGVARTTVQGYLDILEDTLLVFRLPAYDARLRVRERKSPKLYWGDTGLAMHVAQESEPRGAHLENMTLHDLLAWRDSRFRRAELFYWRTAGGQEVDFVIEAGGRLLPIEVKASRRATTRDALHINAFQKEHGDAARPGLVLHTGNSVEWLLPGVLAAPWWRIF